MFFNTKQNTNVIEAKSHSIYDGSYNAISFTEYLLNGGHGDLSALSAINLYKECAPFSFAIDLRAQTFASIPVRVRDKKTQAYIEDHESLELLSNPNGDVSQIEFLKQISSFLDITGNMFIVASGNVANTPLELISIAPQYINFSGDAFGLLSLPGVIDVNIPNTGRGSIDFKINEGRNGFRYVNASSLQEIWHTREFNPSRSAYNPWGMSKARPILKEIEQFVEGNVNNLSVLKRGARPSMAWINAKNEAMTQDQWDRAIAQKTHYEGAENAGKVVLLDGTDIKQLQLTNKDMEFKDLQRAVKEGVLNQYNIPLALASSESMTLDNLKTSMMQLLDRSVIPHANFIYSELTRFLMPRYKNSENLEFVFNEADIPALRQRMIDTAKTQSEIGVNTDNELRSQMGYEELESGGDFVFKPQNIQPVGEDAFTGDNLQEPAKKQESLTSEAQARIYADLNRRGFSDDEIKSAISKIDFKGV